MRTRIIFSGLISGWLLLTLLQSLEVVKFGLVKMPFSWFLYTLIITGVFISVDYLTHFRIANYKSLYILILIDFLIFNSAIIFDWYSKSALINRVEHVSGSMLLSIIIFLLINYSNLTKDLAQITKLAIVFAIINALGVLNEIIELGMDYFFKTENIGPGQWDTNLDLLMNVIGFGVFFAILLFARNISKLRH